MKNNDNRTLLWIYGRIRKFIPTICLYTLLSSTNAITGIVLAFISKHLLDSQNNQSKTLFAVVLLSIVGINILISSLCSMINIRLSGKFTISLRNHLFSELVHRKYNHISKYHSGELINRFTSDIDILTHAVSSTIPSSFSMIFKIVAGAVSLFIISPKFAAIILTVGIFVPAIGRTISKKYKYMHKEVQRTEGASRAFMQESFENLVVIKSFRSETPILSKLNQYMSKNFKIKIKRNNISIVINFLLHSFFNLGYYGIMVWGAFNLGVTISYGTLNAFLQLISQLSAPLQNVSGILPQYYQALASAERLMDISDIEKEPKQLENDVIKNLGKTFRKIQIKNVAFAYENELILQNCSFEVPRGSITALTGESGCGKSTLFKLILGLYDVSGGSITIDDSVEINASTRALFSYVPQGNMILSGSIRENVTLCDNSVKEEDIKKALITADIYDYISSLPEGLDTVLSERGAGLSEGQIQRLSIARALLFDAPILLLDEATSALDEQTETVVLKNIKSMTDKTVLFITHRNTSISVCDHIVHAENGKFTVIK